MNQRDINEEAAYVKIADNDFKKRIYDECDEEDKPFNKTHPYEETHQSGCIILENLDLIKELTESKSLVETSQILGDIGIQISGDGRIWVCINSIAFIRFKPDNKIKIEETFNDDNVFDDRINVRPLMDVVEKNCGDSLKEEFTEKMRDISEDEILSSRILKFLNRYGVKSIDNSHDWNGPDSAMLEVFAINLVSNHKLFYPHSEWGSGCYKPYTSLVGRTEHDELLRLINKRLHKQETVCQMN